ncbi:hypothetical protein, partial [Bartonella sp. CL1QHWL]|uniref:hypothetical protein n=1 Tax=Bartonella sp. CL1QHWL TaxID=3243517 RepID=UPI0035CFCF82
MNHIRVVSEEIEEEMDFVLVPDTDDARFRVFPSALCGLCAARTEAAHGPDQGLCGHCAARTVGHTPLAE